ncbi:hypothetical protein [Acetobacter syzygii]|uniref:hypothetical protein n=1 Tax=Acetobacter syzygii TaxID=146476 RepID=UPI0015701CA7|nr:hypothetical protein [Acetobacter syzygii]NSL93042.1 hypothetical protein [Acetobacter syzygii]
MDLNNVPFTNEKSKMYMTLYACLLAMILIHLGSISKNIFEKLISFLEFCDDTLSVMMARELLLAKKYFEKGHVLGFFKYIQKNRQGILEKIRNMSWDLCHIRLMEKSITINPTGESRYFFPALLTFDRDLIEVIDLYPLKSCVFKNDGSDLRLFFDGSLLEELSGNEDDRNIICERFYSNEAIQKRSANRAQAEKRLPRIIKEFEERVCKNAQVSS